MPPPVTEMWADETRLKEWYEGGAAYWATTEPTNDGVLGGFRVHEADIRDSRAFISPLLSSKPKRGLDVGAGIGRVTGGLLIELCEHVDLLEECVPFVEQARVQLAHAGDRVNFLCMKMQDFAPEAGLYDLIWIQWCLGSLSDADVVAFLQRCRKGLADPGAFRSSQLSWTVVSHQLGCTPRCSSLHRAKHRAKETASAYQVVCLSSKTMCSTCKVAQMHGRRAVMGQNIWWTKMTTRYVVT
eukprot:scaffold291425_cov41-Tisochrysis_lutea.AAC.1